MKHKILYRLDTAHYSTIRAVIAVIECLDGATRVATDKKAVSVLFVGDARRSDGWMTSSTSIVSAGWSRRTVSLDELIQQQHMKHSAKRASTSERARIDTLFRLYHANASISVHRNSSYRIESSDPQGVGSCQRN